MPVIPIFPYRRPVYGSVRLTAATVDWPEVAQHDSQLVLGGWDPGSPVPVLAAVELDAPLVLESTGLSAEDAVRLGIAWHCPVTSLRGAGHPVEIEFGSQLSQRTIELAAEIPGRSVAGWVDVQVQMVLSRPGRSNSPVVARLPGSVLWAAGRQIVLQGSGSRFPVESIDFTTYSSLADAAGWHLEWDRDDLSAPVHGRLRLLVNSKNAKVREAVAAPDGPPENQAVMAMMEYTIAHALITGALSNSDFLDAPDQYPEGSVGAAVRRLMRVTFPQSSPGEVAASLKSRPDRFDSDLQAGLRVFGDGS